MVSAKPTTASQPASVSPQPAGRATLKKGAVPLSLGNVVARVTAEVRLTKHQDFSKTWGRSINGSLGKVFARVTAALEQRNSVLVFPAY